MIKINSILILFLVIIFESSLIAQTVTIKGNDKLWAGTHLVFYTYADQITYLPDTLGKCNINESGEFSVTFNVQETMPVYSDFGIYRGLIYVEPNAVYTIKLPGNKAKSKADEMNPYYVGETIYFTVLNDTKTSINYLIEHFDRMFNDYLDARFYEIYKLAKHSGVDTVIKLMDSTFVYSGNPYFQNYKKYKFALLKYFAYIRNEKVLTKEFYRNQPILLNNSSYMNLFNQAYDHYFTYFAKTKEGENLSINISKSKSVTELKKTLSKNIALDDDGLKELVILKGLHDCFFSGEYKRNVLLQTLDSFGFQTNNASYKKIAENIKAKVLSINDGGPAPAFELLDKDSVPRNLNSFNGSYVYLGFCSTTNYSCEEEFELMKIMNNRRDKTLEFVSVFTDDKLKTIRDFVKKKGISWIVLQCKKESSVLKEYKVKVFPAYYLIDPSGKLIASPAKTMKEGFENYFYRSYMKK